MVGIAFEVVRRESEQLVFHLPRRLARREPGAIGDTKDVRVDRDNGFPEGRVENDIRRLAANARQCFEGRTIPWNFTAVERDERFAGLQDVGGLGVEQADGLDVFLQPLRRKAIWSRDSR